MSQVSVCEPSAPAPADTLIDAYTLDRIEYRVQRLTSKFQLDAATADDVRQDMALELLKASSRFNPEVSNRRTFTNGILDRYYRHLLRHFIAERKRKALSLSRISDEALVVESDQPQVELAMDVESITARLPKHLRDLAGRLGDESVAEIGRSLNVHRSTVYRWIDELRSHFEAAGYEGLCDLS